MLLMFLFPVNALFVFHYVLFFQRSDLKYDIDFFIVSS